MGTHAGIMATERGPRLETMTYAELAAICDVQVNTVWAWAKNKDKSGLPESVGMDGTRRLLPMRATLQWAMDAGKLPVPDSRDIRIGGRPIAEYLAEQEQDPGT